MFPGNFCPGKKYPDFFFTKNGENYQKISGLFFWIFIDRRK